MFTFRAEYERDSYETYTAARFAVERDRGVACVGLYGPEPDTEPERILRVGAQPDGLYRTVYVMNAAGKTVDTIR